MKSLFMCLTLCLAFFCSYAAEYKATLLGTESEWTLQGITDKGQVFGGYQGSRTGETSRQFMFFHDPKSGLLFIEPGEDHFYTHTLVANNNGQIIGSGTGKNRMFIWSKALGVRSLDLFNNTGGHPLDFNDLGQMIGTYNNRPFL